MTNYSQLAETLDNAAHQATPVPQLSLSHTLNIEEAYAVQSISIARRYIRGEKRVGLKLGFTSKAKMEQMGVHDMIWGRLTDQMQYKNGSELPIKNFIHPRAEPEIAFRVSQTIVEPITLDNALQYIDGIAVAIEVIDSRYKNFKFSLEDVVADNCSSAAFTIGEWQPITTNIRGIAIDLTVDNETVQAGNSDAILGNPFESLVNAARLALQNGEILKAGDIILAGAATPAIYLKEGQTVMATAEGLGEASLKVC